MKGLGAWILTLAQPLLAKILIALGITITTITGVTAAYSTLKGYIESNLNSAPAAALQIAALAGAPEGIAMVLGAVTFVIALWTTTQATKLIFK